MNTPILVLSAQLLTATMSLNADSYKKPAPATCEPPVKTLYSPGDVSRTWGGFPGFDETLNPRTHWLIYSDVIDTVQAKNSDHNITVHWVSVSERTKQMTSGSSSTYYTTHVTHLEPASGSYAAVNCDDSGLNQWPPSCSSGFNDSTGNTLYGMSPQYDQTFTFSPPGDSDVTYQKFGFVGVQVNQDTWTSISEEHFKVSREYPLIEFLQDLSDDLKNSVGCCSTVWQTTPVTGSFAYTEPDLSSANLSGFLYKFQVSPQEKVPYRLRWEEVHQYPSGPPMIVSKSCVVDGSAGDVVESDMFLAAPESGVTSTVSIRFISAKPELPARPLELCRICPSARQDGPSAGATTEGGPTMVMEMGRANYGQWAGEVYYQYNPKMHGYPMISPIHLNFVGPMSGGTVVTTNSAGAITNVITHQMEADVKSVDAYTYQVNFYLRTNNARISGTPFIVWTFNNPDGAGGSTRMYINETQNGSTINNLFESFSSTNSWVGTLGNGLRKELWKVGMSGGVYTKTFEVYDGTGAILLSRDVNSFAQLADKTQALISEQNGNDKPATYAYDAATDNLALATYPDGSWLWLTNYSGRLPGEMWAPLLNSSLASQNPNDHRVTQLSYLTQAPLVDDGSVQPNALRRRSQFVSGKTVEQSFRILSPNRIEYRRGQNSEIAATASDDLITVVANYASGAFQREPFTIQNENGVVDVFYYTTNTTSKTTTRLSGEYSGALTNIVKGTKTVTQVGIAGDLITEAFYSIPGDYQVFSKTTTAMDYQRRPVRIDYMDGTYEGFSYDCCGVSSKTNRDGSVVSYTYDALKRIYSETQEGVSLIYGYDGAGQLLSLTRLGTNGNSHPVFTRGYSLEGRLLAETNALGQIVTFQQSTNSAGETIRTASFPNNATWSERTALDGTLQEVSGTAARPFKFYYGAEATGDSGTNGPVNAYFTKVVRVASDAGESEWTKTYSDMLGRNYKRVFAAASGSPTERVWFGPQGQLARAQDADNVNWLYLYNKRGELEFEVLDMNRDNLIDWSGLDRITQWTNEVVSAGGSTLIRSHQYSWEADSLDTSTLISTVEMTADWLTTRRILWNGSTGVTNSLQRIIGANGAQQLKMNQPWGENLYSEFTRGRLQALTRRDTNNAQLERRSYSYDKYGRLRLETDARDGTSTLEYDDANELVSFQSPAPGNGRSAQVLSNFYNNMGWLSGQRLPDGSAVTNFYTPRGELQKSYGALSYPVEYTYDAPGRLKTLNTWQDFAGNSGTTTTTWNYDPYRGFLSGKTYAAGAGPSYTYTAAGRLSTRVWARGTNTVYGYDDGGGLSSITYNDGATPSVSRVLDRRGRTKTLTQNSITTTFSYGAAGQRLSETYSGGILGGVAVTNGYDSFLRRTSAVLAGYSGTLNGYGYDIAGRLWTVGDGTISATYSYLPNSSLHSQILFKQGANTELTTVKAYDYLDRMTSILSTPAGTNMSSASLSYLYNDLNQRKREMAGDGSGWIYGYDSIGQLTSGKKVWEDGVPVEGQQFEYVYDDIGNRKSTKEGGNASGQNLRSATYTPNTLNQYSTRSVPNKVDVLGISTSSSTVQINSSNADYRRGPYFREELSVSNSGTNAIWQSINVTAGSDTTTGNLFIPGTTQNFYYDADGNLTNDYTWSYIYNGENQLAEIRPLTNSPAASKKWLTFKYDYAGRRIGKTVAVWTNSAWNTTVNNRFLYDGWNLIAELNATNNNLIRGYIWGQDLSGTIHGAGGVGGLLAINDPANGSQFVTHDAKGNVTALVSASNGAYTAQYEYDPFGRLLRATGPMAANSPFHFSDKYEDTEVGLIYYGYRYYNPSLGTWQNRDPIGEWGGVNVYGFNYNDPVDIMDASGLSAYGDLIDWVGSFFDYSGPAYSPPLMPFQKPEDMTLPSMGSQIQNNFGDGRSAGQIVEKLMDEPIKDLVKYAAEQKALDYLTGLFSKCKILKSGEKAAISIGDRGLGEMGGKLIDPSRLDRLKKILAKRKGLIKVDSKYMDKYYPRDYAVFEPLPLGGSRIVLREDATEYHLYHELKHWGDYNRLSASKFEAISNLAHEESVFKYLQRQKWLTKEEAAHAEAYINSIRHE